MTQENPNGLVDVNDFFSRFDLKELESEHTINGVPVSVLPTFPEGTKVDVARLETDIAKASTRDDKNIHLPMSDYYVYPESYDPDGTLNLEEDSNSSSNLH